MLLYHGLARSLVFLGGLRLRQWLPPVLVTCMLVAFGALAGASGNVQAMPLMQSTATTNPNLSCVTTFTDDFPYGDNKVASSNNVVVGGEHYTSAPRGTSGVRLRDFYDTLVASTRPGGANYGGAADPLSGWDGYAQHGFSYGADGDDGIRIGGTGDCTLCGPVHENQAGLAHTFLDPAPTFKFRASVDLRVDEVWGVGSIYNGGAGYQVIGLDRDYTPAHIIVFSPGAAGGPSGGVGPNGQVAVWDGTTLTPLWNYTFVHPIDTQWHRIGIYNRLGSTAAYFDYQVHVSDWQGSVEALSRFQLAASVRYAGAHYLVHYRNFLMNWVDHGDLTSVAIPLPAGATQYGVFNATDNGIGTIRYYVRSGGGAWTEIRPGADLSALGAPVSLRATIDRDDLPAQVTDPVPVLLGWSVDTCSLATATPTATNPPRTATPTNTPRPTSTPRPTATPPAYFQVAPLRPAVHLKADPALDPPEPPYDQTDWREVDPIWYPLQVYAGLVPFAYVDPALPPPQLCYWSGGKWNCVPGVVTLKSYTLTGIEMEGRNYLDKPISVEYVREHRIWRWNLPQYRYDRKEYVYVNWLAPDGVMPHCLPTQRCVNVVGVTGGVSFIVYDVVGNIHWDAIAGVGGPYDYGFTNSYRVPISLWYPRAEP